MNQGGGDRGRGPAPQAAIQLQDQAAPGRGFDRGNRGAPPQMVQAPHDRGNQNRGFERYRGAAPQMAIQAPRDRGDQTRDFNRGERNRGPAPQMAVQAPADRGDQNRGDRRMGFDRQGNRSALNDNGNFNRDGFNRDGRSSYRSPGFGGQRHDFSGFRDFHRDFRASHRFQIRSYRRPAGWYSHRWAFGEFLPAAFWVRDYWLIDFADYDLPPPPYGAIWVRVDRDALLIDEDSGEIITVVYDVFY